MIPSVPEEGEFIVTEKESQVRLDKLLADRHAPMFSRTYFEKLIEEGFVTSLGKPLKKREKLLPGAEIEIFYRKIEGFSLEPEPIPLDILYEDQDLLIVNKPCGMVVHPAPGHPKGTFVNALLHHCSSLIDIDSVRPGIVHRLDKETSGLLIGAKHEESQRRLIALFSERRVEKEYYALVTGTPPSTRIETVIGRDPRDRKKMANNPPHGRQAISHVETLQTKNGISSVRVYIETGRTHQVRLHLLHMKTPVIGDLLYNPSKQSKLAPRMFLHARKLSFPHPMTGSQITLEAPIPSIFMEYQ